MLRLFTVGSLLLYAQSLPHEALYFSGKVSAFGKKVTSAYKRQTRDRSPTDPTTLGTVLAYALYETDRQNLALAEQVLRPFDVIFQERQEVSPSLRFFYYWIKARWARAVGYINSSFDALQRGYIFARAPWEIALLRLESAENLLLLGNTAAAVDTLSQIPLSSQLQEPYRSYLNERIKYLQKVALWQQGAWDSLKTPLLSRAQSQHQSLYNAEYAYLRARALLYLGHEKEARRALRQSITNAKRTPHAGKDFILRAKALETLANLRKSYKPKRTHKLRTITPLLTELRSSELPTTYAIVEAIEHLEAIGRLTRKSTLTENLIGGRLRTAEGLCNARLHRLAARAALAQYKGTIATSYASQAALQMANLVSFPALETAASLAELGEAALFIYQYKQADSAFRGAYQILHALNEPETPITLPVWAALGRYKLTTGRYKDAEAIFLRQRGTYQRLLPKPYQNLDYLRNELSLVDISLRLDNVAQAESSLTKIAQPIRDAGEMALRERIALEEALGDLAQLKGQYKEAEKHYMEAIRLRQRYQRTFKDEEMEDAGLLRLAMLYQRTGQISRAREVYQRIKTSYERSKREDAEAAVFYISLADFYLSVGDYLKAEESANHALELNKKLFGEISPGYANAALVAARVEHALGRYDKEKTHLIKALSVQSTLYESKPTLTLARTLYLLGENALFSGQPDSAAMYLTRSAEEAQKAQGASPVEYASLSLDIGGAWLAIDSTALAEPQISAARTILESRVPLKNPMRLRAYLYTARLLRVKKDYPAARQAYNRWLKLWASVYSTKHPEYPFHLAEIADLYWIAGDKAAAKRTYTQAVNLLLEQVDRLFNGLTESEKTRYWVRVRQVLEHYFAFSFGYGSEKDKLQAYETYLTTKAYLLSETAQLRNRLANSRDTTIQRIFKEWQDQKEYVVRLYTYSPEELKSFNINLAQEEERLNALEKQLTQFVGDIRLKKASWKALRSALSDETAAIDWIRLRLPTAADSIIYYAVITTPSMRKPVFVLYPDGRRMETIGVFRYSQAILNFEIDTSSYGLYWAPVAKVLPSTISRLIVSNDGVFNQINLATLRMPEGGHLVDKYEVMYRTRLASLISPPKPLRYWDGRKALLVADPDYAGGLPADSIAIPPLPGTREEVEAIRDILQSEGILAYVRLRSEAAESLLYEAVSPYILHVATHGLFLPYAEGIGSILGIQSSEAVANPLFRSALLLADAGRSMILGAEDTKKDGIANAYELLSVNLANTELVVLSACETGLGDIRNGEGVYGLQRAFLLAGARHLIVSLWRVDDEATRDFMITFYTEWLRKKLPIDQAFVNAQRAMRRMRTAPYYWGAFLLVRP